MSSQWNRQPKFRIRQGGGGSAPYQSIRTINPSRGLNLLIADILANDKEATGGSKNIEYVEGGAARKRMGYAVAAGSGLTTAPKGLAPYISESANYVITSDGGVLKKYQSGAYTALAGAVTLDPTANISMTALFQKTYAWDGVSGGIVWDGSSVTRPGTMPRAKFSVIYKGYHVASGVDGQPFRLYLAPSKEPSRFTRLNPAADPNDVSLNDAANVPGATVFSGDDTPRAIDINRNDGQKVTGLGFFQDVLIVFKENSIYQLYFNESNGFVVERISNSYGAVCHGAIASVENDCYFLTDKGVYVLGNEPNYYASIRTNELSSRIKTLLQRINPNQYARCQAYYFDDRYFLSVPLDQNTECNAMIVYDRRFYAWAYWDNIKANAMLSFKDRDVDGKTHFYFTEYGSSSMCEFTPGVYNDKGEAIEAIFITRAFDGKSLDQEKYWYVIRPIFRLTTGSVQLSFITENGSIGRPASVAPVLTGGLAVDQIGNLLFGTSQQDTFTDEDLGLSGSGSSSSSSSETDASHAIYDIGMNFDSRTLKVKFMNNGVNETFTLLGWVIYFQMKDPERFDGAYTIR
jgi:hypothetical protein